MAQESEFIYEEYSDGAEQVLLEFIVRLRSNKDSVDKVYSEIRSIRNFMDGMTDEGRHELVSLGEANPLFSEFADSYGKSVKDLLIILDE
tara:strand:+ start:5419 stop:5688 length:270 start_codon:yes stop_codon:yes gene_type:complete